MFEIKLATGRVRPQDGRRTAQSKINCEELDPFPLSGIGIELDAVFSFAVNGGRFRIQHLERVATPRGTGENAIGILFLERRRSRCWPDFFLNLRRKRFLLHFRRLRENQAREGDKNPKHHELFHHCFSG